MIKHKHTISEYTGGGTCSDKRIATHTLDSLECGKVAEIRGYLRAGGLGV